MRMTVRPSGTEPKIKMYFEVFGKPFKLENIDTEKESVIKIREDLEKNVMQYCYQLLDVDFPERGFLLFWQLPLDDKLKYFEIEDDITRLKSAFPIMTNAKKSYTDGWNFSEPIQSKK